MKTETNLRIFITALILSLFFSLIVSMAAVILKPIQTKNEDMDRNKNVLKAAGLESGEMEEVFKNVEYFYYDIADGKTTKVQNTSAYFKNFKRIVSDPEKSIKLSNNELPGIKSIPREIPFYLFYKNGKIDCIVLPVFGNGLWSTMYGFIGINADGKTIKGLTFYDQKETPGLGGEVDNPLWKKQWKGKLIYDEQNKLRIKVLKGKSDPNKLSAIYEIDGLSGASMTTAGVDTFIRFWLDDKRFGRLLKDIGKSGGLN